MVPSCSQHSPRRQKPHKPTATVGKERWGHERDGEAGCEQGEREAKGVPSVKRRRGGVESLCKAKSWERRAGLENHGLQEAETHHQVQGDGGLQQVPVQPQVPEPGHAVQVGGGEVLDGHQRGGADLRPVDFCGERRKSRVRVREGREGCKRPPLPAQLSPSSWGHPQNGVALLPRGGSPASPRRQGQPQGPSKRKILLLLGNEGGHAQPKQGEEYGAI